MLQPNEIELKEHLTGSFKNDDDDQHVKTILKHSKYGYWADNYCRKLSIIIVLSIYAVYLLYGYINQDSTTKITFETIDTMDAPFLEIKFFSHASYITWIFINEVSYYNKTSKKYGTVSFYETENDTNQSITSMNLTGNLNNHVAILISNNSNELNSYTYEKYSDTWVIFWESWHGYNKWYRQILIPPKNVVFAPGDRNTYAVTIAGKQIAARNVDATKYLRDHANFYGFYWGIQDVSALKQSKNVAKKISSFFSDSDSNEIVQNGWVSFSYRKWIYLLPTIIKNKIENSQTTFYTFGLSSEAFTSQMFVVNRFETYYYSVLLFNIDTLQIKTKYIQQRKYSLIEIVSEIGGYYTSVATCIGFIIIYIVVRRRFPKAELLNQDTRRYIGSYLALKQANIDLNENKCDLSCQSCYN